MLKHAIPAMMKDAQTALPQDPNVDLEQGPSLGSGTRIQSYLLYICY
jgi:hypothetical protein